MRSKIILLILVIPFISYSMKEEQKEQAKAPGVLSIEQKKRATDMFFHFLQTSNIAGVIEALRLGADINAQHESLRHPTALHIAVFSDRGELIEILLAHGAKLDIKDDDEDTPFVVAMKRGNERIARLLLRHKPGVVNDASKEGNTALHLAVYEKNRDKIKFLLGNNADWRIQNKKGHTPLHLAAAQGQGASDIVQCLLENHVDANILDAKNLPALHLAIVSKHSVIVKLLLEYRADTGVFNGMTALALASKVGDPEIIKMIEVDLIAEFPELYKGILQPLGLDVQDIFKYRVPELPGFLLLNSIVRFPLNEKLKRIHEQSVKRWKELLQDRVFWGKYKTGRTLHNNVLHLYYVNGLIEHRYILADGKHYKSILEFKGFEPAIITGEIAEAERIAALAFEDAKSHEHRSHAAGAAAAAAAPAAMRAIPGVGVSPLVGQPSLEPNIVNNRAHVISPSTMSVLWALLGRLGSGLAVTQWHD